MARCGVNEIAGTAGVLHLVNKLNALRTVAACAAVGLVVLSLPQPAAAGFFDRLFGGFRRAVEAPVQAVTEPFSNIDGDTRVRAENRGPSKAFCVRSCDGHYFPVMASNGMSPAEACSSFCPAAQTKLYMGSDIDYATAQDGSRYADMPNAFAYRKQVKSNCSCNGRSTFGLAHIDARTDPTLRPGDIVATEQGLLAFTGRGGTNVAANFTPVSSYNGLSKTMREKLSETKISDGKMTARSDVTASIPQEALDARAEAPPPALRR